MNNDAKKADKRYFCDVYVQVAQPEDVFRVFHETIRCEGLIMGYPIFKKNPEIFLRIADPDIGKLNRRVTAIKGIDGVNEIGTLPFEGKDLPLHQLRADEGRRMSP